MEKTQNSIALRIIQGILQAIQESMIPVIPMIMAGGLIKVLVILMTLLHLIEPASQTYTILNAIGDAAYYFLPFEVAVSAALYFKLPVLLPVATVGIMFAPSFLQLFTSGDVRFFGILISNVTYSYSVLPIILLVWVISLIYKGIKNVFSESLFNFFGNMLTLLLSSLLAIVVIGPFGNMIAEGIRVFVLWLQGANRVAAEVFFAVVFPFLNMCGLEWPLIMDAISTVGREGFESLCIVSLLCVNVSQGGACLATGFRAKNKKRREECLGMGFTAVFSGASEPSTYSNVRYRRPMIAALIGSACAGLYAGIVSIRAFSFVPPAFATILIFLDATDMSNIMHAVITGVIALVVSFGVGMALGFKEPKDTSEKPQTFTGETI